MMQVSNDGAVIILDIMDKLELKTEIRNFKDFVISIVDFLLT